MGLRLNSNQKLILIATHDQRMFNCRMYDRSWHYYTVFLPIVKEWLYPDLWKTWPHKYSWCGPLLGYIASEIDRRMSLEEIHKIEERIDKDIKSLIRRGIFIMIYDFMDDEDRIKLTKLGEEEEWKQYWIRHEKYDYCSKLIERRDKGRLRVPNNSQ
ncbi:hypothetical protein JW887_00635 [Candidatus Dojkabacteria bacterium]|nr:hypothetical protein [Candidatus Dojkabacteria bacterium]